MTKTFFYKKESQNLIILQEEEWKWKKKYNQVFFLNMKFERKNDKIQK